jgi:DNA-directed RNA polymerase specialized sigma24 family protein
VTTGGSVTHWLHRLGDGDAAAAQPLWERYFDRLVRLARQKLSGAPRRAADEEDVALSAFDSFQRGAAQGRFPELRDRHNLWAVLVLITARKAWNLAQHERRQKRGGGRVISDATPTGSADSSAFASPLDKIVGREPSPAFAALVAEEYRLRLDRLPNDDLRRVAVWKMEGYTNAEIAAKIDYAVITVERRLNRIRKLWEQESL